MSENTVPTPWYRQPWFWFLTIFPLASITWGITVLVISSNMDNSMVTDDYSKQGRGINMAIARDERAREMGVEGTLNVQKRAATLMLETQDGAADFPYLVLNLYHPTLSNQDRTVQFQRQADGEYTGKILEDLEGRWYYDLQGPTGEWRVKGEMFLPASQPVSIDAGSSEQG